MSSGINVDLLRYLMRKKRVPLKTLAQHLGISNSLVTQKANGRIRFTDYQVKEIQDFLQLSPIEVTEIFYSGVILTDKGVERVPILRELNLYIELITHGKLLSSKSFDPEITGHIIQKFLSEWIRTPDQNIFTYAVSDIDIKLKYKFLALSDLIIHKFDQDKSIETVSRLFEKIDLDLNKKIITLTINNKSLRSL